MRKACVAAALFASLALAGCDSAGVPVDCHSLCTRYSDCFDSAYDVAACDERCNAHGKYDTEYRYLADLCDACIDDRVCPSEVFTCAAQCASVLP